MAEVSTLRGPVDSAQLGTTYMYEHIFVLTPDLLQNYPADWDEEERVTDAVTKVRELKSLDVDMIVDPTVVGLGRYIPRLQRGPPLGSEGFPQIGAGLSRPCQQPVSNLTRA